MKAKNILLSRAAFTEEPKIRRSQQMRHYIFTERILQKPDFTGAKGRYQR